MTAPPEALDYAPAPAGRRRRRAIRLVALTLVVVLVTWGALNRAELLRWMQQKQRMWAEMQRYDACASYNVPRDLVAWEEDPAEIERLTDSSSHTLRYSRNVSNWTGRHAASIQPWPWRDLDVYGAVVPAMGVVFMHERASTAGGRCLVVIQFSPGRSGVGPHLAATLFERGSLTKSLRHNGPMVALADDERFRGDPPLRLYAGQVDPADDSRFTIRYKTANHSGTIDGWLEPPAAGTAAWEFGSVRMTRRDDEK